jgi:ribosomal protein S7
MNKDNKNNKLLYNLILGFFIKNGNKVKAKKILDKTFLIVKKKSSKPFFFLMKQFFFRLSTFVEVKKVKTKSRTHSVPFVINSKRRIYLVIK